MKAAYFQFAPAYLQVEQNLEVVERHLEGTDADLIVLPELFTSGYFFQSKDDLLTVAEPVPEGPSIRWLQSIADRTGATLVAGLPERDGSAIYNSAVLIQPEREVHVYRKVHLFYEENTLFQPGDLGFPVFDVSTRQGTTYSLGMMVCFDWYFPKAARTLALNGADVIAHPSNLVLPHCPDAMPVRARENHVFTITANRYGEEEKDGETLSFIGQSEICGPDGEILRRASKAETELGDATIDPLSAQTRHINEYNDVLQDRRPASYAME